MDIKKALLEAFGKLKKSSSTPHLDAEILLSFAIKKPREFIMAHPEHKLTKTQEEKYEKLTKRRQKHEPIAYILGQKEFFGIDFKVTKDTLVPRPETELLVEKTLKIINKKNNLEKTKVIDVGTGSGNIIISIADSLKKNSRSKIKSLEFYGLDVSKEALQVARYNAKKNKLEKKIKFSKSDLLSYFLKNNTTIKQLDNSIIIANLPYLDKGWKNLLTSSDTKGLKYEPSIALYAGEDGLDAYRELAEQLKKIYSKKIILLCEIGHVQVKEMKKIFSFAKKVAFHKDLGNKWRIAEILL